MKRERLFFSFLLLPLDYLSIVAAGVAAFYLRYAPAVQAWRPVIFNLKIGDYLPLVLLISALWLPFFAMSGLYMISRRRRFVEEIFRVFIASSTGLALIVIIIFFRRELFDSRFIVLAGWALAFFFVSTMRGVARLVQSSLLRHGWGVSRTVLVGNSKTTDSLVREFATNRRLGVEVVKRIRDFSLETEKELDEFLRLSPVDEVIQSDPNLTKAEMLRLYDFADEHHLTFKYAADLYGARVLQTEVAEIAGIPVVEVKKTPLDGWGRVGKRIFDVTVSSFLIVILSPVMLLMAILIKLDSRGPVFFSRRDDGSPVFRVGQGGRPFRYFKFRSMRENTDSMRYNELAEKNIRADGPMVKIKDDPRITRIGRILRRTSFDEFAELFLVWKGDMSLVGPRPHLPEEVAKYEHHHKKALTLKPGMTGLAQISGRSDLSFEDEVRLDTYYIENWSLLLDLSILLKTPFAMLGRREAL